MALNGEDPKLGKVFLEICFKFFKVFKTKFKKILLSFLWVSNVICICFPIFEDRMVSSIYVGKLRLSPVKKMMVLSKSFQKYGIRSTASCFQFIGKMFESVQKTFGSRFAEGREPSSCYSSNFAYAIILYFASYEPFSNNSACQWQTLECQKSSYSQKSFLWN